MELLNNLSDYGRTRGDLPELPIINMFAEANVAEGRVILQSRPGLAVSSTEYGTSPIRAIFREPAVLDNSLFVLAETTLYRDGVSVGTINGSVDVSIDAYTDTLFLTAGESIWSYNGTTLASVAFPDSANTGKVLVAASRLVVIRKDTQALYWSDALSSTIDALSFASAENSPDDLEDMLFIGDVLVLFGERSTEFWTLSADPDAPFVPVVGRVYSKGIRSPGCATKFGTSFAWVTHENKVCIQSPDNIISTREIEKDITATTAEVVKLWTFTLDSIEFLALTTANNVWVYSDDSKMWSRFTEGTLGTRWEPDTYGAGYFGSRTTGRLLTWSEDQYDISSPIERRFRVYAPLSIPTLVLNNVTLRTNPGQTSFSSGAYANPSVQMRASKDGGETWGSWRTSLMGTTGKYRTFVRWLANGIFSMPGVLLEFKVTDPVPLRVSSVLANEAYGGY